MKSRVVVCAIITRGNLYLLGQKPKDIGPYPNTWHLLGGGVDLENENLEDAMRREIREEAGIEVTNLERLFFDEDQEPDKHNEMTHYVFLQYKAEFASGEIKANDDIHELKWFEKEDLKTIPLTKPLTKLFNKLGLL